MSNYDGDFEEFFDDFEEGEEIDYGYAYFPDATKIFDYDELNLLSNVKYKILGYIDGLPIIQISTGMVLEIMENEIDYIKIVPPDTYGTVVLNNEIQKYINFIEELWLDNAIDLSLKYRDEKAFKILMLIKYPSNNSDGSQA